MSWLKKRAEEACDKPCPWRDCDNRRPDGSRIYCTNCQDLVDAIEAVAREFAIRALGAVLHPRNLHAQFAFTSVAQAEGFAADVARKAIAAADTDETP